MTQPVLPPDYHRIRLVGSFEELVATPLRDGVNALCWPRRLEGDFAEVAAALAPGEGITPLDETILQALKLGPAGRRAVEVMLADRRRLQEQGLQPSLDCIHAYPRDEKACAVRTDVYSFHADSATTEADTYLCTYHGPTSEGLRNEEARRHIDDPRLRAALLADYGGADDADFEAHLHDLCYDLHYTPLPGARPFAFGHGNLWRIAIAWPGCPVPPCVHRAPDTAPGQSRLLLIS